MIDIIQCHGFEKNKNFNSYCMDPNRIVINTNYRMFNKNVLQEKIHGRIYSGNVAWKRILF